MRYPREIRERTVALVLEHQGEHSSQWACIQSVATKSGMTPETLRRWVRQAGCRSAEKVLKVLRSGKVGTVVFHPPILRAWEDGS